MIDPQYFGCDPRDIAIDFIEAGITDKSEIEKTVDGAIDADLVYRYVCAFKDELCMKSVTDSDIPFN